MMFSKSSIHCILGRALSLTRIASTEPGARQRFQKRVQGSWFSAKPPTAKQES